MRRYAAIVTGDRHARSSEWSQVIIDVIGSVPNPDNLIILHGAASGIDTIADAMIEGQFPGVPRLAFPAQWGLFEAMGKRNAAGPARNHEMLHHLLRFGDAGYDIRVLAFHNFIDNSRGTRDMVEQARRKGVPVSIFTSRS